MSQHHNAMRFVIGCQSIDVAKWLLGRCKDVYYWSGETISLGHLYCNIVTYFQVKQNVE